MHGIKKKPQNAAKPLVEKPNISISLQCNNLLWPPRREVDARSSILPTQLCTIISSYLTVILCILLALRRYFNNFLVTSTEAKLAVLAVYYLQ
jgi:hypothetical protein